MSPTATLTCANHPDAPVASFCRTCGKPLCVDCRRVAAGAIFCEEHAPKTSSPPPYEPPPAAENPWTAPPPPVGAVNPMSGSIPWLAFGLGFIPGVGAIYNGQYAKGLVHAVVFGLLVTAVSSGSTGEWHPLFGILIAVFEFYMALEAYHTARKHSMGLATDEFSGLMPESSSAFPTGAVVLIGLGFLLLLNTLDLLRFDTIVRFWPIGLILIGVYMLYGRMSGGNQ